MCKRVITVSRACGSGGRTIAKKVAEKLGIHYYDKKLLELVAQKSGLSEESIEEQGEYATPSLIYNMATNHSVAFNAASKGSMLLPDQINAFQTEIIQELAAKESCVIVGRAADYILRGRTDCLNVFVHADMESKKKRIISEYGIAPEDAEGHIRNREKKRMAHYRHYTDQVWGEAPYYHICLDSSTLEIEKCVDLILLAAK